jgi:hypothetical protein
MNQFRPRGHEQAQNKLGAAQEPAASTKIERRQYESRRLKSLSGGGALLAAKAERNHDGHRNDATKAGSELRSGKVRTLERALGKNRRRRPAQRGRLGRREPVHEKMTLGRRRVQALADEYCKRDTDPRPGKTHRVRTKNQK